MIKRVVFNRDERFYIKEFCYDYLLSLWFIAPNTNVIEEYSPNYGEGTHIIANEFVKELFDGLHDMAVDQHIDSILLVPLSIPFSISEDKVFGMPGEFNSGIRFVAEKAIQEINPFNIRIKTILENGSDPDIQHREKISKRFFEFLINNVNLEGGVIEYE